MPSNTINIDPSSDLHKKLISRLSHFVKMAEKEQTSQQEIWKKAEEHILGYVPESDADARRRTKRDNSGEPSYTTLKLPYSYALLMAAHTYWTSVFFGRTPIHQFQGEHGEDENQVMAVEAMMSYQVNIGEMLAPYYLWLYDAGKYGVGIIGEYWEQEVKTWASIEIGEDGKEEIIEQETQGYTGNKIYNVSPYDWLPDPRVTVGKFQQGEFVAVKRRIPWAQILNGKRNGSYTNLDFISNQKQEGQAFDDTGTSSRLERPDSTEDIYLDPNKRKPGIVQAYEIHVTLVPSDWGLYGSSSPQKWVFVLTNQKTLLISARPLGLIHDEYPFSVLEPEVEAYGQWNRGIPEIIEPIQNTMDWLLNSHFYNVRSVLNNIFVADPTRIVMKDLQQMREGGIIRVKPEAYGQDIRQFFQQLNVQDVTQNNVNDMNLMLQIGERITGINDQILGVLAGGGRKTATEVRTSTGFGVNRLKTTTEYMSATGFANHARRLVQQSQQYYDGSMKMKLVGDKALLAGSKFINVTPEMIAGYYSPVPADGTLPVDRFAQATLWKDLLATMQRAPQVMQQYDLGRIFAWVAQLAGLKNLDQFKIEVAPDAQLQQQAQAGNVIPVTPQSNPATSGYAQPDGRSTGT